MRIIALGHKSRVGKDEFAKFLKDAAMSYYPKSRVKIAGFSDKLKETVYLLYKHIGVKDNYHYEKHPEDRDIVLVNGKTVVDIWIDFGNHCRAYDPYIWVNALFGEADCDVLIIKDCRFPNECEAVKKQNGWLIKCNRPGVLGRLDSDADNALNDFQGWDKVLVNDAGLGEWYVQAKRLMKEIIDDKHV